MLIKEFSIIFWILINKNKFKIIIFFYNEYGIGTAIPFPNNNIKIYA